MKILIGAGLATIGAGTAFRSGLISNYYGLVFAIVLVIMGAGLVIMRAGSESDE